ncbi:Kinetochore protein nuf2 [Spironucleus salmonicida]|uniref:Kinetochore protein nuf2 n=1 Tax=Spironucleus salmonicida TaxID=348837 RepID=V6LE26_9EUKA|nr:Kinetochore protein nuf2 [Spironucleus salmonicida]|eukprot:EST41946.1 Kinetochore protein nuf2 [Spironucleus salmonicida]
MQKPTLSFPLLSEVEILSILREADFQLTKQDLDKPNPDKIKQIYSFFVESCELRPVAEIQLLNQDKINNVFRISTQDVHSNSLPLLTLYVQLRDLFKNCQVNDFTLSDLTTPNKKRFTLFFSALTNFLRFKSMLCEIISDLVSKFQANKDNLSIFYLSLKEKQQEYQEIAGNHSQFKSQITDFSKCFQEKKYNLQKLLNELKSHLTQLQQLKSQQQSKVRESHNLENINQNLRSSIQQQQQKIIAPDAPLRITQELTQMMSEMEQIQPRRDELQKAILEAQQHILKQSQLMQDLETLEEFTEKSLFQNSQLGQLQEILGEAQSNFAALLEEKSDVEKFILVVKQQTAEIGQKDKQFLEVSARNDFNEVYGQLKKEQIFIDDEVCQSSDKLEELKIQVQELRDQIGGVKNNCVTSQKKLVDLANELLKGYVVQMSEMGKIMNQ